MQRSHQFQNYAVVGSIMLFLLLGKKIASWVHTAYGLNIIWCNCVITVSFLKQSLM